MDERSSSESPSRRRFLGSLSAALGGTLAGCPGRLSGPATETESVTPAPVPTADSSIRYTPSLDGIGCPGFPGVNGDVTRLCGSSDERVSVGLGITQNAAGGGSGLFTLPRASIRFRFYTDRETDLSGLRPPWSLQKYVDGNWYTLRPTSIRAESDFLATGGRGQRIWELAVDNDATARLDPRNGSGGVQLDGSATRVAVAGLGGGVYAFVVAGWLDGPRGDPNRPVAVGSRFRLDGPSLTLSPTEAVDSVTRAGSTVTVESDPGLGSPVTYVLSPSGRGADAPPMLPEQAATNPPVRNLLAAYSPDVGEVVLHTRRHPAYPESVTGPFTMGETGFEIRSGPPESTEQ